MDKFGLESVNHQVSEALNPNTADPTMSAMQHQLMREQHDFYMDQQRAASTPPGGHDFSWEGIKEAARGVVILMVLGLILKYIFHVG